jgi:hypothetical protein
MTQHNGQFDDLERRVSDRLGRDLSALYDPPGSVPPEADNAVRDQIHRRFAARRPLVVRLRWAGGIAAAAAVVALGVILYDGSTRSDHQSRIVNNQSVAAGRADFDDSGRVDILDAFRLARHIEARGPVDERWDLTGDGRVDRDDVDLVASAAVRLGPERTTAREPDTALTVRRVLRTTLEPEKWCVLRTLPAGPSLGPIDTSETSLEKGV